MVFPFDFENRMKKMLGDGYAAFFSSYDKVYRQSLRVNPVKVADASALPFDLTPVAWAENGFYYADGDRPGRHPLHELGAYYIQESSAMIPASLCPPMPGEYVLDLCAAPGGKTTQLAAAMNGRGLLVANEIHPGRATILSENVERMGIPNCLVTNESPDALAARFPACFDKITVDAPCSGEGMFRKEPQAMEMWSQANVTSCAERQLSILDAAAGMLKPGGHLTYSTCTFAPEENEGVLLRFLQKHPDFHTEDPRSDAVLNALNDGVLDKGNPDWTDCPDGMREEIRRAVRCLPHHADGEGHFAVLLKKDGILTKTDEKKDQKTFKPDRALNDAIRLYRDFEKQYALPTRDGAFRLFGERLYLLPVDVPTDRLRILRCGLCLGTARGGRFEPDHALALALGPSDFNNVADLNDDTLRAYMHGESVTAPDGVQKGWTLLVYRGLTVSFGKTSDGLIKNHYPKGLRK